MAAALIDPTVAGKYPVILGDGLLGKTSNEIFTGIRYNHKPEPSSPNAPDQARLKPSVPGKTTSYDLTYTDDDESYAFTGARSTEDDDYVLYFDAERQAFILDKVDSTFHMNVTRMPGYSDAEELSRRYPHLGVKGPAKESAKSKKGPAQKTQAANAGAASDAPKPAAAQPKRKTEKKPAKKLTLPVAAPEESKPTPPTSKPKPAKQDEEEEEDEDDDDGGLLIEYPEGPPVAVAKKNDFSPAFPAQQRFDDYMDKRESGADDADGESDDETDLDVRLLSPVLQQNGSGQGEAGSTKVETPDDGMVELEVDLEKAMEMAFEDIANSQEEGQDDESEISEED